MGTIIYIYTAIFGSIRDSLFSVKGIPESIECHAYVDGVTKPTRHPTGWLLKPAHWQHKNPRLNARRHKLLSHVLYPEATYTLWVDGCLTPKRDPRELVTRYLGQEPDPPQICVFSHAERNCIYQEAKACEQLRKDNRQVLQKLAERYRRENYPPGRGLAETTAVLRYHSERVKSFNEAWWAELRANSIRDQMSFDYLIWKQGLQYATFEGSRTNSPYFDWRPHR